MTPKTMTATLTPAPLPRLPAFEVGLALFEKRADALVLVLAGEGEGEEVYLAAQALVEVGAGGRLDRLLGHAQRDGALLGDAVGQLQGLRFEVGRGDDEVDEAEVVGVLRVDHVAREDQLHRLTLADESRQALGAAAAGDDAEVDLGLAEARRLAGDADVAGEGQLAAAAEAEAVDHGDDRLGEGVHGGEERARRHHVALRDGGAPHELTDVGAGDESLLARAGDDDDADG